MSLKFVENKNGHCRLCTEADTKDDMVACDECDRWFHFKCVQLKRALAPDERWICIKCKAIEVKLRHLEKKEKAVKEESTTENFLQGMIKSLRLLHDQQSAGASSTYPKDMMAYLKRQALMKLPRFNGSPRKWLTFKKVFEDTTKEGEFSNIENLNRLQEALEGYAAKSVQALMLEPANVPEIMQNLEQNFGRPELVYKELIQELQKIKKENKSAIIEVSDALENLVNNVVVLQKEEYLNDPRLVDETVRKLPYDMQIKWAEELQKNRKLLTLKDLSLWLKPHAVIYRQVNLKYQQYERENRINLHQERRRSRLRCVMCSKNHKVFHCEKFKAMDIEARYQAVLRQRLCIRCLGSNHVARNCWFKAKCGENGCIGTHNRLLHRDNLKRVTKDKEEKENLSIKEATNKPNEEKDVREASNIHQASMKNVYYQILPVTLRNKKYKMDTYAFLDQGSSLTLLDEDVAKELQLDGKKDPLKLKWTQNVSKEEKFSKRVHLHIFGDTNKEHALKDVRTVSNLHLPLQSMNYNELSDQFVHLRGLPIDSYENIKPKLLIGLDHSHLLVPLDKRAAGEDEPIAIKTKLGWTIFGNIINTVEPDHIMIHQTDADYVKKVCNNQYLPTVIRKRYKRKNRKKSIKDYDTLSSVDSNGSPGEWLADPVIKVIEASDRQV